MGQRVAVFDEGTLVYEAFVLGTSAVGGGSVYSSSTGPGGERC